ncbi:MAG: glycerophosphodiester phosphodiesterase family protein [Saprospiraceae bacterium]|nr:glycerophosphodiester phosphodiesterase family protein [Saprospiraceae bacterium]
MPIRFWFSTVFCCMMACQADESVTVPPGFDWQGHRGCRGLMPENTIPAFLKALEFEAVTTLELDLAVSADGRLVLSHEPWFYAPITTLPGGAPLEETAEEQHLLFRLTAEEIRRYDVGIRPHPRFPQQKRTPACKPTLQEVVDTVRAVSPERAAHIGWNMEIKSRPEWDGDKTPPVDSFARLVVAFLQKNQLTEQTTVQSFDVRALQAVRKIAPQIRLVLLVENNRTLEENLSDLGFVPAVYSPDHTLVNQKLVQQCREKGLKLIPWTINEVPDMRRLIRLRVDGIITDYPDRLSAVGSR